jgi:hypothetical protein
MLQDHSGREKFLNIFSAKSKIEAKCFVFILILSLMFSVFSAFSGVYALETGKNALPDKDSGETENVPVMSFSSGYILSLSWLTAGFTGYTFGNPSTDISRLQRDDNIVDINEYLDKSNGYRNIFGPAGISNPFLNAQTFRMRISRLKAG